MTTLHHKSRPVALVTGGGRGLGAAISRALADDGWAVAINYRRDHAAANHVRDAIRGIGRVAETYQADITDSNDVVSLRRRTTEQLGDPAVLVINATGPQPELALEELTWADMLNQLRFFALSPLLLTQAVVPAMRKRRWGRIIFIGSEAAELGVPRSSAYAAARAAQLGLMRSWSRELAPDHITVNLVAPGFIPTDRHADTDQAAKDAYVAGVPLQRLGTPAEVAGAVG